MTARLDTLEAIERACWRELAAAVHDRGHDWRVLALATADEGRADARSVILRDVDETARTLVFYADRRSPKIGQLQRQPLATMLGWSRTLSWQVRLRVALQAEDSGLEVSSRWARVKLSPSVGDYLAALPPGTPVAHHRPERGSREHFAVVVASVSEIDWLELHPEGHRRARFGPEGRAWLTP